MLERCATICSIWTRRRSHTGHTSTRFWAARVSTVRMMASATTTLEVIATTTSRDVVCTCGGLLERVQPLKITGSGLYAPQTPEARGTSNLEAAAQPHQGDTRRRLAQRCIANAANHIIRSAATFIRQRMQHAIICEHRHARRPAHESAFIHLQSATTRDQNDGQWPV